MAAATPALRIGCAGPTIPGQFAAAFPAEGSHLERYARVLSCLEINSSFHRPHKPETWLRWARAVPEHFRFSVKAPKTITHEAKLACEAELLQRFLQHARGLGEKLGPVLFQLPPKLAFEEDRARRFFGMLRESHRGPVVCEPRHASWFEDEADQLLKDFEVARVAADPPRVPPAARPGGWAGLVYFRLHGSPRTYYSAYSREFLEKIVLEIKSARGGAASEAWCIFDNTASGAAIGNALEFRELAGFAET